MGEAAAAGGSAGGGVVAGAGMKKWWVGLTHQLRLPNFNVDDPHNLVEYFTAQVEAHSCKEKFGWLEFYGEEGEVIVRFNRDHVVAYYEVRDDDTEARGRSEAVEDQESQDS